MGITPSYRSTTFADREFLVRLPLDNGTGRGFFRDASRFFQFCTIKHLFVVFGGFPIINFSILYYFSITLLY